MLNIITVFSSNVSSVCVTKVHRSDVAVEQRGRGFPTTSYASSSLSAWSMCVLTVLLVMM